ncbi:hypothetical protein [Silicimonas algicola]|uniref:Uncharacterized protein n=1 Tax=Silicimonas algicola TaxID=1826607 RepID=A0A316G802_9RHOB|nr:hypothetical protein [Silicimonas algicola]PWK57091.1 hypothetical protein C8D95_103329 [Silicimonas algicola]
MTQHDTKRDETQTRIDLAAAIRLSCRYGWHEGVANHSAAVSADARKIPGSLFHAVVETAGVER